MSKSVSRALRRGRGRLAEAGIESCSLDAAVLLSFVLRKPKEWLFAHDEYVLTARELKEFWAVVEKRAGGAPVAYIVNCKEFMGISFYVDENVLVPRSDTEILVERLIAEAKRLKAPRILDLCTGSGCIAVSAAYYRTDAIVTGVDLCREALAVAARNAAAHGVADRTDFVRGDLFERLQPGTLFDIIVSNPPYITEAEMETLPAEVKREPRIALCGGVSGLDFYERIAEGARAFLKGGGRLLLEVGAGQAARVVEIMNKNGYNNINIYEDLAGHQRVAEGENTCSTG